MAQYNDVRSLLDKVTGLERRMLSLETASRVENASVGSGGINIRDGGSLTFREGGELIIGDSSSINVHGGSLNISGNGELIVDGPARFNSTTTLNNTTTFGGQLNITSGSLVLPSGSISNNALAEQLEVKYSRNTASNFGVTTSWATKVSTTIAAPSWATSAAVMSQVFIFARYTGQGNYGIQVGGSCAGTNMPANASTLGTNEQGRFGNIGRGVWSNIVNNPSGNLSFTGTAITDRNNEMPTNSQSWAEIVALAVFMR